MRASYGLKTISREALAASGSVAGADIVKPETTAAPEKAVEEALVARAKSLKLGPRYDDKIVEVVVELDSANGLKPGLRVWGYLDVEKHR